MHTTLIASEVLKTSPRNSQRLPGDIPHIAERILVKRSGEVYLILTSGSKFALHDKIGLAPLINEIRKHPRSNYVIHTDHADALSSSDGLLYDVASLLEGKLVEA